MNDTLGEFIRDNATDRRDMMNLTGGENASKPFVMSDGKVNINERYVQTKLDKMCGIPRDSILYFSRQNIKDATKKERNDQTLGRYLEELADTAKLKCIECNQEKFQHSQEIYHRSGQI